VINKHSPEGDKRLDDRACAFIHHQDTIFKYQLHRHVEQSFLTQKGEESKK